MYQAISKEPFNHSPITASFAADIIDKKYNLGVPLDRYSNYLTKQGFLISTKDLSNYVVQSANLLTPLYKALQESLIKIDGCNVIHADETPLKVLDNMKSGRTDGYVFVYSSSFYDSQIYLYDFSETRETTQSQQILKGFKGCLVVDGYAGYNVFRTEDIKIQRCWAHVRRKFFNIYKALLEKSRKVRYQKKQSNRWN